MKKIPFFLVSLFIFQLLALQYAEAHKVSAYAYREGDKVIGECYFVDGSPCKDSKVEVYNEDGGKILETVTDEKGRFNFKTSNNGELKIVIPAGEGHMAEYRLEAVEQRKEGGKDEIKRPSSANQPKKGQEPKFTHSSITKDELRQIIDEAMDARLQGLEAEIMDIRKQMDKVGYRDIIGGIGYIIGIWGLIMILKRKKDAS